MRRRSQRGLTLIEMTVVMAVAAIIVLLCYSVIDEATRATLFVESHNDLAALSQRPVNTIQAEAFQSKQIFTNSTVGQSYYSNMIGLLPAAYPIVNSATGDYAYPVVDSSTTLLPDTAVGAGTTRYVGNCLLIVKQLPPVLITWNPTGSGNIKLPVDLYEFQFFYLSLRSTRSFATTGNFVDLVRAYSITYADRFQLNNMFTTTGASATEKTKIATGLANYTNKYGSTVAVNKAWDPTATTFNTAFYTIASDGTLAVMGTPTLALSSEKGKETKSLIPEFAGGRISGKMEYSVGFRNSSFPSVLTWMIANDARFKVPKWSLAYDSTKPYYPSGFEVKIVGSGVGQKLFVRLLLMSQYGVNKYDAQEAYVITSIANTTPI